MPRYSDLFAKQPAPARGGRLSALSREELQAYVDDVAPTFAQRFGNEVRANAPPNYETGTLIERGQRDLARMGQPMTLDQAAVATAGVPGLGDVVGLAADARAVYDDPSWSNIGGAALGALPFVPAMAAIRAYHGSPHDFDRFDMSKIGTGEGAQAYGHGLYFAEAEDVAKSYKDTGQARAALLESRLSPKAEFAASFIQNGASDIQIMENMIKKYDGVSFDEIMAAIDEAKKAGAKRGHMYEVNINADPDDFLDWDRPLSEGHPVRSLVQENARRVMENASFGSTRSAAKDAYISAQSPQYTGEGAYRGLSLGGSKLGNLPNKEAAAKALREAGIPGIKYLDQGSRAAGEGSRNYVVFDDALVEIIRKYGLAAVLGGTGAFGLMSLQGGEDGTQPPL